MGCVGRIDNGVRSCSHVVQMAEGWLQGIYVYEHIAALAPAKCVLKATFLRRVFSTRRETPPCGGTATCQIWLRFEA
jgi:hypothetical protein